MMEGLGKKLAIPLTAGLAAFTLPGCGSEAPSQAEALPEVAISAVLRDPEAFRAEFISLSGSLQYLGTVSIWDSPINPTAQLNPLYEIDPRNQVSPWNARQLHTGNLYQLTGEDGAVIKVLHDGTEISLPEAACKIQGTIHVCLDQGVGSVKSSTPEGLLNAGEPFVRTSGEK